MKITRQSMFTGKTYTKEIDVTEEQLRSWKNGALIQNAMPNLTAGEREFIMTGVTDEEWAETFAEEKPIYECPHCEVEVDPDELRLRG